MADLRRQASALAKRAQAARQRNLPIPIFLLVLGLIFLLLAVGIEHPVVTRVAENGDSTVLNIKTLISFLKEIGFALLIAWGVSAGIEKYARERDEENAEQTRGRIAEDVVHAVFGLNHDPSYVRTVIEVALHKKVVRDFYDCEFTIEPLTPAEELQLDVPPGRLLRFTHISKYTFVNVSNESVEFDVRYSMPARFGQKLREFAGIKRASLASMWLTPEEIASADVSPPGDSYKSYCWKRTIGAHQTLDVVFHAVSIKELSDNEVWGNYHATYKGMDMVVHVKVPGLRYGIRGFTATKPKETYDTGDGDARWGIDGPVLPNDSVVFWWRSPEDDGRPTQDSAGPDGSPTVSA